MPPSRRSPDYLVVTPGLLGRDGIATVTRHIVEALLTTGQRVDVLSLAEPSGTPVPPEFAGVRCRFAGNRRWRLLGFALQAALRASKHTQVIVTHKGLLPVVAPLLWRGARLTVFIHGIEVWKPMRRSRERYFRRAACVMANSAHTVAEFKRHNPGFANWPVQVCHLGRPVQLGDSASEDQHSAASTDVTASSQANRTMEPLPRRPYALIVGRMSVGAQHKGRDLLLEIWPQLVKRLPEARLVMVGGGDDRARLQAKATALGVAENIDFPGEVSGTHLAALYEASELFVMPSTGDGFGLVYLEAMFAGKPCIGATGAAAEIIVDGVTGLIVEPRNGPALLAALERLMRDPVLCQQMGAAGRTRALENFTSEHFAHRFLETLAPSPLAPG